MKLKVTASKGGPCNHQLRIEGAPMILLMVLNSEGLSHSYEIDSLRVNRQSLSPLERELYNKWNGKFDGELEKYGDDESSEYYAMYFISIFSPAFDCTYIASSDEIVDIWNKINNYASSCGKSEFELLLSRLFREFAAWLKGYFGDILGERSIDHSVKLSLFEKPDFDASDPSILYSFGYDLSFNSAILSVEMGSSGICYRVTGVSNPGDLSFYQPNILESNTMLSFEYLSDLAKEVEEGLWPSALYATIAESGTIEALLEKSSDAQNHPATRIEITNICEDALGIYCPNCAT